MSGFKAAESIASEVSSPPLLAMRPIYVASRLRGCPGDRDGGGERWPARTPPLLHLGAMPIPRVGRPHCGPPRVYRREFSVMGANLNA